MIWLFLEMTGQKWKIDTLVSLCQIFVLCLWKGGWKELHEVHQMRKMGA